jgi:hypothetical protein
LRHNAAARAQRRARPLIDAFAHGGRTIVQIGLDHYYRDPEFDLKTLALALTVAIELGSELPRPCLGASAA